VTRPLSDWLRTGCDHNSGAANQLLKWPRAVRDPSPTPLHSHSLEISGCLSPTEIRLQDVSNGAPVARGLGGRGLLVFQNTRSFHTTATRALLDVSGTLPSP